MKYSINKFFCILLSLVLTNCSRNESSNNESSTENIETEQNCLISEIRFATSRYEYIYDNSNELKQIINTYNSTPTIYEVNKITNDSITIGISSQNFPTISVKYDDGKLIYLKRFYNPSTANVFIFEYKENKITVRQDYSYGTSYQNVSYGDYFIDQNGNVTSAKLYRYDINSPNSFTLFNELNLTYDSYNNPWKDVIYPTFLCQNLPHPMFFSQNNILSETISSNTNTNYYSYDHDINNLTIKGINKYPYNVCSGVITLDEYYKYTNCYDY